MVKELLFILLCMEARRTMINFDNSILVVEDCPEDYNFVIQTFKQWNIENRIVYCQTGDDALDFLYKEGKYTNHTADFYPGVILLDLNLPGTDGREVLNEIKKDEKLKYIPVIIMTSSEDERDAQHCYRAGAHAFLHKPLDPQQLITTMSHVEGYSAQKQTFTNGEPLP